MEASKVSVAAGVRDSRKVKLLAGGAIAALAIAALAAPASAASFTAGDATQLQAAINAAIASGQPSTITLTASFAAAPSLPPTVPITIDTQGFTLTGVYSASLNSATLNTSGAGGPLTLSGSVTGADDPAGLQGNAGLRVQTNASVINNGSIKGGAGAATSASNTGVLMSGGGSVVNNGAISGGDAGASAAGGLGMQMTGTPTIVASLVNNGLIQGADTSGKNGGAGLLMGNPTGRVSLINNGTIRGGSDLTGAAAGGGAIRLIGTATTFINTGTIAGGNGAEAIDASSAQTFTLVNSGVIRAGAGQAVAIELSSAAGRSTTLELQAGSAIQGAVVANANATDTLRLGGTANATFDVSAIGAAAQYQNFDIFEKTGASTWTLTGTGTTATPWTIQQGTLQIGDGGASGSIIGDVVNNGALAFNRSDTLTHSGAIAGTGSVSQVGTGTTILNAVNNYTGGTALNAGVLQVSSDGNVGGAAGGLTFNGGTLQNTAAFSTARATTLNAGGGTFRTDADLMVSGVISGAGRLTKTGATTLILTGANAYAGGTAINGGVLQVASDGALGDAAGGLGFDGGTLQATSAFSTARATTLNGGGGTFRTDADLTASGVVSGAGRLTKTGAGVLTLTGTNSYSGGVAINGGVVQVSSNANLGDAAGGVGFDGGTLQATAAFSTARAITLNVGGGTLRTDADLTASGVVSGAGGLIKTGSGALALTGANGYAGGTTISAGTLRGSATSFGSGAIVDNAALVIDQPTDAALANALNGAGSFTKIGAGRLNYTGVGSLSGATTVSAGTLAVNGSLAQSAVEVRSGGSLGGNGAVGATTIRAGGLAAPGNSIGTLHVAGNFVQEAGSTYQVELDPNTNAADLIDVTGTAALAPGAGLNVIKYVAGNYRPGAVYRVLSAAGGLTGTYALSGAVGNFSAFLALQSSYDANNAYLRVVQTGDPGAVAETPNEGAVSGGLPAGGEVDTAILNVQSVQEARNLLDQLSGDGHAAAKGGLVNDSRLVRDLAVDRLRDILCAEGADRAATDAGACPNDPGRAALWGQAFGAWGQTRGQAGVGNVHRSTSGFLFGLDLPIAKFGRLGYFGGYSRTDLGLHARTGDGDIDNYHLGLYGGTQAGRFGVRFGAAYSWQDIATARQVVLPNLSNYLRADYDAGAAQAFAEVGYRLDFGPVAVEPFVNAAYVSVKTSAFSEWGGPAALSARSDEMHDGFTTLGARPSTTLTLGSVKATIRGLIGWRHAFGEVTPTQTVAFTGGPDFVIQGAAIARDAGVLELGADMRLGASGTLGLTYGGEYSDRVVDQSVRGQLTFRF